VTVLALANLVITLQQRAARALDKLPVAQLPHPNVEAGLNVNGR
jgi:hypothetical protein